MDWAAGPVHEDSIDTRSCLSRVSTTAGSRRWREVETCNSPLVPPERSGASCVAYGDSLWLYAGYGGGGRLDDLWRFDLTRRVWSRVEQP